MGLRSQAAVAGVISFILQCSRWSIGSRDIVTIYNWGYNPTYNQGNPFTAIQGVVSRVISPVLSSY